MSQSVLAIFPDRFVVAQNERSGTANVQIHRDRGERVKMLLQFRPVSRPPPPVTVPVSTSPPLTPSGSLPSITSLPPVPRRPLWVLFATGLLFWTSITSLLPTIPLYIRQLGGTETQIGMVMGAFAIGLLLSRPRLGTIADLRSRTLVLRLGVAVAMIAPLLYVLASTIPQLFLVRVFHGISIAAFTTAYSTLVTDIAPTNRRGETLGYMSLVTPIGLGIGPGMGSAVAAHQGFVWLFSISAGLGLVGVLLSLWVHDSPQVQAQRAQRARSPIAANPDNPDNLDRTHSEPPNSEPPTKFWSLLLEPRLLVPSLTLLLVGIIFGTIITFIPLFIDAFAFDFNIGLFYSAAAVASFLVRPIVGRLSDAKGRGPFICLALLCYFISMALLSLAVNPAMLLLAGLIEGVAAGTMIPTTLAIVSDRSRTEERGRLFSLCISGFDLGVALAGPLLAVVAGFLSYRNLFALSSGVALLALLLFSTRSSKSLGHSLRFVLGREGDVYAVKDLTA